MKRLMVFSGVLALVAVALTVWLVLDRPKPQTPEEEWRPEALIEDNASIRELTIKSGDRTIKFTYLPEADSFSMIADGQDYFADKMMVDRVMSAVLSLERKKLIALEPPDLAIYNLKPPQLSLSVKFDNSPRGLELEIGKENYTHDALFAKLKDEPTVFLIPMDLAKFIEMNAASYRSHSLLYTVPMKVASIEIKIDDPELKARFSGVLEPKLVVQKQAEGQRPLWNIVSPINEPAVFQRVEKLFQALRFNNALEIIDSKPEELGQYGLTSPRATLTLTLFSGEQHKVMFGREQDGKIYVMNSVRPEVFVYRQFLMEQLLMFSGRQESPLMVQREILASKARVEYPREGLPSMELELRPDNRSYSVVGKPDEIVMLGRLRRITKPFRENNISFAWHREPYPREKYGLDRPRMRVQMLEGDTVPLDVAFGNTLVLDEQMYTYVEDIRRKCIILVSGDVMSQIPYGEREFTAPPKPRQAQ